ncbi:hypothetical protein GCM10010371_55820 [Streptomyces subrutilus]|uniref:Uncharacterized protein n=1 Tax=Streptomyces subrutilus TaxID=36818 RepID=A0A918R868_9ACTN|nr:hypothetical protein GCM10010371_55820 [Streptomyces subrutilus]
MAVQGDAAAVGLRGGAVGGGRLDGGRGPGGGARVRGGLVQALPRRTRATHGPSVRPTQWPRIHTAAGAPDARPHLRRPWSDRRGTP